MARLRTEPERLIEHPQTPRCELLGPLADYYTLPGWDCYEDRCGPMYETRDGVQL